MSLGPVSTGTIKAYLIEALSWGGSSGAPVFVDYFDPTATSPDPWQVQPFRLLGLVNGHDEIYRDVEFAGDVTGRIPLNAGIAVVVPAQAILDLLSDEAVLDERKQLELTHLATAVLRVELTTVEQFTLVAKSDEDSKEELEKLMDEHSQTIMTETHPPSGSGERSILEVRRSTDAILLLVSGHPLSIALNKVDELVLFLGECVSAEEPKRFRTTNFEITSMNEYVELTLYLHKEGAVEVQGYMINKPSLPSLIDGIRRASLDA